MRWVMTAVALACLGLPALAAAQTVEPLAAQLEPPLPSPVVAGDWPDPDVTLIDGSYYSVATSGGWAPTFRVLRSTDLREWEIAGSVFRAPPRWAKDSFWAPELAELPAGGFALFYSAMPKRAWTTRADGVTIQVRGGRTAAVADADGRALAAASPSVRRPWYCLGVATAPSPTGPWRDLGRPLRCTPRGTIDPTPVIDGGDLQLVYKEDGNAFRRPTPILIQRLRADGRRLLGAPRELLRNRRGSWEANVIEAPFLVQRDGWWHMLYSGALCCSPDCAYAVGAARARSLAGPWTRYPGNPILRSGNGWRCPGHVSVAGDRVAFHAYRSGAGILAGRQLHIAPLTWRPDGWPAIGDGRPVEPTAGGHPATFDDAFSGPALAPEWEWPITHPPAIRTARGLTLRAPARSTVVAAQDLTARLDAGLITRRLGSDRFTATAVLDRGSVTGRELAGIAVTRGGPFAIGGETIGIALGSSTATHAAITTWTRGGRRPLRRTTRIRLPGPQVHLRIAAAGRRYRLLASPDGTRWTRVGPALRSPVDETARVGLTVGAQRRASARFLRATLTEP